jgi:hypothetical protein
MKAKYPCPHCGGTEFISQLNRYDIYRYDETDGKIHFTHHEYIDDSLVLFCRDCCEKMPFDEDDIIM